MLAWLKKRVRHDEVAAERHAVQLVHKIFGPGVEDMTPVEEHRPAA